MCVRRSGGRTTAREGKTKTMYESEKDELDAFIRAYPDDNYERVDRAAMTVSGVCVTLKENYTISPDVTDPLLRAGWAISSHSGHTGKNTFYFRRFSEEEVVETVLTFEGL